MKLFYSPGACSLSVDIAIREAGLTAEMLKTDLREKKTEKGEDFLQINPKGYVPVIQLDDGQYLTEASAILQYVADQNPSSGLAPARDSFDRYRLEEWLNFLATEIHKTFGPFHNPAASQEAKDGAKDKLMKRFGYINGWLEGKEYIMSPQFTVADAYCYTLMRWVVKTDIEMAQYPNLAAYMDRVKMRPHVQEALAFEGLQ